MLVDVWALVVSALLFGVALGIDIARYVIFRYYGVRPDEYDLFDRYRRRMGWSRRLMIERAVSFYLDSVSARRVVK